MPKERRKRSLSFDRSQASPYPCSPTQSKHSNTKNNPENEENTKEWEEARCPVCMEYPHNAVLLMCSSHEKGCRPYMCDTSYRHSNCLDQFRKSFTETPPQEPNSNELAPQIDEGSSSIQPILDNNSEKSKLKLVCPLCRGKVTGWTIVDTARSFMNAKSRTCASETCEFCGTYSDLRKHAREEHPLARPSAADPERERSWRRLERQRDFGDLISTLQSLGEERSSSEESGLLSFDDGGWLTVFFLIRVFRPENGSRARAQNRVRRRSTRHWGETYERGNIEFGRRESEINEGEDGVNVSRRTRLRRLRRQSTPEDEEEH